MSPKKIYVYKNGEKAFFKNNEKHLISDEEYSLLVSGCDPILGDCEFDTLAAYYIEDKFAPHKFVQMGLDEMLRVVREHKFRTTSETKPIPDIKFSVGIESLYDGDELVGYRLTRFWTDEPSRVIMQKDIFSDEKDFQSSYAEYQEQFKQL